MSNNNEQHQMRLEKTHPSGAEEWSCPTCGRRFLMHWQPEQENLDLHVLEPGDLLASHVGSKGGLMIEKSEVTTVEDEPVFSEDLRKAIEEALEDINFDNWPGATNG